jgi:hypothetical protein
LRAKQDNFKPNVLGGKYRMKTFLVLSLAFVLALPLVALAQDPAAPSGSQSAQQPGASQTGASQGNDTMGKSGNVKGTISQDGKTLVGDDGKSWTIANPDAVKGHEGHHVELKGSADSASNQIQVSSVKMLKGDKGDKKDSSQPQ